MNRNCESKYEPKSTNTNVNACMIDSGNSSVLKLEAIIFPKRSHILIKSVSNSVNCGLDETVFREFQARSMKSVMLCYVRCVTYACLWFRRPYLLSRFVSSTLDCTENWGKTTKNLGGLVLWPP